MIRPAPWRFLVVDEHPGSRFTISFALEQKGYVSMRVASSSEALAAIDTFTPDVVLLEWVFRDGSGIGLSPRLRQRAAFHRHELILIAMSVEPETAGFLESEQLDGYLVKPATIGDIERALASCLELRAPRL